MHTNATMSGRNAMSILVATCNSIDTLLNMAVSPDDMTCFNVWCTAMCITAAAHNRIVMLLYKAMSSGGQNCNNMLCSLAVLCTRVSQCLITNESPPYHIIKTLAVGRHSFVKMHCNAILCSSCDTHRSASNINASHVIGRHSHVKKRVNAMTCSNDETHRIAARNSRMCMHSMIKTWFVCMLAL